MGLDMYLTGTTATGEDVELGYWRKHPNLHGYIVRQFAGGVDECQRIPLSHEELLITLAAVGADNLPDTSGSFFGVSRWEHRAQTIEILTRAIRFLGRDPGNRVTYQASW